MSDVVLKVENLYKRYRLGAVDRQAFKEDMISWWASIRGKPDPYEQYITSNELATITDSETLKKLAARYVWALQDINFEVKQGEIVGVIGKNGAGKSTLLKILSKTTTPTKGQVKVKGRIASLLEVGTGFHGELTGRENIYLNGAILGMNRHEIKKHLDEIVDFAGIDAYIDTPVKRYSSGMYVRLAFAVGAHLLSDILIVDEVLAVGDAEFQKKCIGKMKDVSAGEGKTVLFVSHNMISIKNLCSIGIYLKNGNVVDIGNVGGIITKYIGNDSASKGFVKWEKTNRVGNEGIKINSVSIHNNNGEYISQVSISESFTIDIDYEVIQDGYKVGFSFVLMDSEDFCVFGSMNTLEPYFYGKPLNIGGYKSKVSVPANFLNNIRYRITIIGFGANWSNSFRLENILEFNGLDDGNSRGDYFGNYGGVLRPILNWETINYGS